MDLTLQPPPLELPIIRPPSSSLLFCSPKERLYTLFSAYKSDRKRSPSVVPSLSPTSSHRVSLAHWTSSISSNKRIWKERHKLASQETLLHVLKLLDEILRSSVKAAGNDFWGEEQRRGSQHGWSWTWWALKPPASLRPKFYEGTLCLSPHGQHSCYCQLLQEERRCSSLEKKGLCESTFLCNYCGHCTQFTETSQTQALPSKNSEP